jgi:hypothetical protein
VPFAQGLSFATVDARWMKHGCGLATSGAAYCWGDGFIGTQQVSGGLNFMAMSTGEGEGLADNHTCGLTSGGAAYCRGRGISGQLGNADISHSTSTPVPVVQ